MRRCDGSMKASFRTAAIRDRIHSADSSRRHRAAREGGGHVRVLPKEAFEDLGRVLQILTTTRDPRIDQSPAMLRTASANLG
jgi:hypothetical protein